MADEVFDDDEPVVGREEISLSDLAKKLGMHRVSLLRMEQRAAIPKARWRRSPVPHRVYSPNEVRAIEKIVEKLRAFANVGRGFEGDE